nr:hypothetical protein [Oceanococcus sp. HetDA_MAG_MS8]
MDDEGLTQQGSGALYAAMYEELKRCARRERRKLIAGQTLATTALVNEAYLKLASHQGYENRQHFLMTAAQAMRQVLVDNARAHMANKRGGGVKPLSLDATAFPHEIAAQDDADADTLVALDTVLEQLRDKHPRLVALVECRYFAGFNDEETAAALGVTSRTLRRDWIKVRALLHDKLKATWTGPIEDASG